MKFVLGSPGGGNMGIPTRFPPRFPSAMPGQGMPLHMMDLQHQQQQQRMRMPIPGQMAPPSHIPPDGSGGMSNLQNLVNSVPTQQQQFLTPTEPAANMGHHPTAPSSHATSVGQQLKPGPRPGQESFSFHHPHSMAPGTEFSYGDNYFDGLPDSAGNNSISFLQKIFNLNIKFYVE